MQPIIYAGLRNPARDQKIADAIAGRTVREVADELECSPSTVRVAAKRIAELQLYSLTLTGGGKGLAIGTVAAKSFKRAALGAYRHFGGTFKNLELPTWVITDGTSTISIIELRDLDQGFASVVEDDAA